jgi:outer membrane protein OmpA-like peptidoglycan-associated protein
VLERALELLNSVQGSRALITGYSDNKGKAHYNLSLSRRRAETVARYLADKGIQRTRLRIEGRGATKVSENTGAQELLPGYNDWRIVEIRISLPGRP